MPRNESKIKPVRKSIRFSFVFSLLLKIGHFFHIPQFWGLFFYSSYFQSLFSEWNISKKSEIFSKYLNIEDIFFILLIFKVYYQNGIYLKIGHLFQIPQCWGKIFVYLFSKFIIKIDKKLSMKISLNNYSQPEKCFKFFTFSRSLNSTL